MKPENEEENETRENSAYNPFPQPQTIPAGWDMSGFVAGSKAENDKEAAEA